MSGACLGELAAALVDGELDHASRERAQRHLLSCAGCRAEVDAQRRLKSSLSGLAQLPAPPPQLAERLLALPVPGTDRVARGPLQPAGPVSLRAGRGPDGSRPAGRGTGLRRSVGRPAARRPAVRRRAAVGSAVAALGVLALALGGPPATTTAPVDPASDSFVVQHVDTTSQVPRVVRAGLGPR